MNPGGELLKLAKKVRDATDGYDRLALLRELEEAAEIARARELVALAERDTVRTMGERLGISHQAAAQQTLRARKRLGRNDAR